jgi:hypothetical protein
VTTASRESRNFPSFLDFFLDYFIIFS